MSSIENGVLVTSVSPYDGDKTKKSSEPEELRNVRALGVLPCQYRLELSEFFSVTSPNFFDRQDSVDLHVSVTSTVMRHER